MTLPLALLLFIGIPLTLAGVIALWVYGASWTRSGRAGDLPADGPLFITTAAAPMDPARLPNEIGAAPAIVVGGGAHGAW